MYINEFICDDLWNHVLAGGMSALQEGTGKLETFFNVQRLNRDGVFIWQGIEFQQVETIHIANGSIITPSFGLLFAVDGRKIFLTTDTQFTPDHLAAVFAEADLIFHDCEILKNKTGVHANYQDLRTLDSKIKEKMWLYHYNPGHLPDAKADGFKGFVLKGQEFNLEDPKIFGM
jgi:ribonuclease BN (tRNA processing enzyme)